MNIGWRCTIVDKRIFKKKGEELQQWLHFRKRGSVVSNKKGKGAYTRKVKHKGNTHER